MQARVSLKDQRRPSPYKHIQSLVKKVLRFLFEFPALPKTCNPLRDEVVLCSADVVTEKRCVTVFVVASLLGCLWRE